jgi:hypothetical protein
MPSIKNLRLLKRGRSFVGKKDAKVARPMIGKNKNLIAGRTDGASFYPYEAVRRDPGTSAYVLHRLLKLFAILPQLGAQRLRINGHRQIILPASLEGR